MTAKKQEAKKQETKKQETEEILEEVVEETGDGIEVIDAEEKSEVDEIKKLEETVLGLNDKILRQMAEFDNFRKRTQKEKQASFTEGTKNTIEKLLPTIDNFERALSSENDKDSNLYKGVEMIYKQFLSFLDEVGVKEIEAIGKEFDPNMHFAVAHEENSEYDENTVVEVLQKGFTINDKVIRASMVKVAN